VKTGGEKDIQSRDSKGGSGEGNFAERCPGWRGILRGDQSEEGRSSKEGGLEEERYQVQVMTS